MSAFTTPNWLKTSQICWPADLGWARYSLSIRDGETAECLLGRRSVRRHGGLLGANVIALNQVLDPQWDQVFVEYNGFTGSGSAEYPALLNALLTDLIRDPTWDEFRLSGLEEDRAQATVRLALDFGLKARKIDVRPAFSRDLRSDRPNGSILSGLSPNTRSQLRKSRRLIENRLGPLELTHAQTTDQASQWFETMAPWHRNRWGAAAGSSRTSTSGFDNPAFVLFHQTLIRQAFEEDQIRLWRLSAGGRVLTALYNFRVAGVESFYLGASDPSLAPDLRTGLVAHLSVMDRCLSEGIEVYDFMAGDSQYKRQLSNRQTELTWLVLQRPRLKFTIEDKLRDLRLWTRAIWS
jgi:hypothetical protein